MKSKITVIGAGSVGATIAYTLSNEDIATEIVLIDINKQKAEGEVMDIIQGTCFRDPISIKSGDYEDAKDSNIVIITSGAAEERVLFALGLTAAVYFIAEVLLVVDEIYRHAVKHQLLDADICLPPAERAVKVEHVLHAVGVFILDDAVIRRYDARVDAELCKRLRQRADDVGQSAGLAQRRALCRRQQHIRQRGEVLFTQYFTKLFFHGVLPFAENYFFLGLNS